VVLTFGKVTSIESAGIHFKLPYPIQSVIKVPVQMTQSWNWATETKVTAGM